LKWASKRRISLFTFTVKAIKGNGLWALIFGLCETGLTQAAIAFEDVAALFADWLGADGREFIAPVRLVESTVGNPELAQAVKTLKKLTFA
jgi:hypothetical protein